MPDTKTIARIKKLLALAKDRRGNENEAEAAQRMAEALMEAANLSEADVADGEMDPIFTIGETEAKASKATWVAWLAGSIAKLVGCHSQRRYRGRTLMRVWTGTAEQREMADALLNWLMKQINALTRSYYNRLPTTLPQRKRAANGFRVGLAAAVARRIQDMTAERKAAPGHALERQNRVREAIANKLDAESRLHFLGAVTVKGRAVRCDVNHAAIGQASAAAVQIHRAVPQAQGVKRLGSGQ
jgi:hypothetical protein